MIYKIKNKPLKERKTKEVYAFRILSRTDTQSGDVEVWELPKSKYAIIYDKNTKNDKRWRVMEVYIKNGEIRTRGDLPFKDYDSYSKALSHIEYNAKIESKY